MYLTACFDESIRSDANEPICVGGYLFKYADYEEFKIQWRRTVLRYRNRRFSAFHMTDLYGGYKEYDGLELADRLAILNMAVDAVGKHAYCGVVVAFDQAEFEQAVPPDWAQSYGSIYAHACQWALHCTGQCLRQWRCPMRVKYLFERGHDHWREANALLIELAKRSDARKTYCYRSHEFVSKGEPGTQTADLLTWTVTRVNSHQAGNPINPLFVAPLQRLSKMPPRQKLHSITGDNFTRFLELHRAGPHDVDVPFRHKGTLK